MSFSAGRIAKGVLFRVVPSLVILGLFELGLRVADQPKWDACWIQKENFWAQDPELGFTYRPGSVVVKAKINERGLRGPLLPQAKPEGTKRILFIGDSTCFGLAVKLKDSFAVRSTALLQAVDPQHKYEYVIGALPGYSSYHSRIMLEHLLPMQPDLVVFYVGAHNDHSRARYYPDGDIAQRVARRAAAWHQVHLLQLLENLRDRSCKSLFCKLKPRVEQARVPPAAFRENMTAMLERTRVAGAQVLVLLPPYSKYLLEDHPTIPLYQQVLEETAREFGVAYVKLQETFANYDEEKLYLKDMFHFRELGHEVTARAITAAVAGSEF